MREIVVAFVRTERQRRDVADDWLRRVTCVRQANLLFCKNQLKDKNRPGENGIAVELIKDGGAQLSEETYFLIKKIWQQEQIPEVWKEVIIILLHKKKVRMQIVKTTEELLS